MRILLGFGTERRSSPIGPGGIKTIALPRASRGAYDGGEVRMTRRLPVIDHHAYERALRMASAARTAAPPPAAGAAASAAAPAPLRDRFGRAITYLRVSVTDRCNLRCSYCAPVSLDAYIPREDILSDDEVVEVIQAMARRGLAKVRFTGGEPLVRPGFLDLVARIRDAAPEVLELCVTTNGLLLEERAAELHARGVTRFNVSIDTLDPARFREVTRGGDLARVLRGLDAALALRAREDADEAAGRPSPLPRVRVKVNAVLMKGVNEGEVERLARLSLERPVHVRFIELMPLAHCGDLFDVAYLSSAIVQEAIARMGGAVPIERGATDGPARMWRLAGAQGTVGVISPVSEERFCERCNRVRLGADGALKLCLFGDERVDLRAVLRARPRADGDLDRALDRAMAEKPEKMAGYSGFTMMSIGG
jgi:cyclic pyranopterin phosphate synthase